MRRPFNGYYPVTQTFGVNPQLYAQFGYKGHNGVDYGLRDWTPVVAPHSGVVVEAGWSYGGYGYYVKVQNGVEGSVLAHLGRIQVWPGQWVNEGQQLGLSDNTGNSTGSHLHWGYYRLPRNRANGYDGFVFQWPYLQAAGVGGGEDEGETINENDKTAKDSFLDKNYVVDPEGLPPEEAKAPDLILTTEDQEAKAKETGIKDGLLSVLFTAGTYAVIALLTWALEQLPDVNLGNEWEWIRVPLAIAIGAIIKGIDRKKHEDPSPSTGLVKV